MLKKSKRALSLVLALMMICSTMGVMAFAQDVVDGLVCPNCFEIDCFIMSVMRNNSIALLNVLTILDTMQRNGMSELGMTVAAARNGFL